jgi:hypothetical protein
MNILTRTALDQLSTNGKTGRDAFHLVRPFSMPIQMRKSSSDRTVPEPTPAFPTDPDRSRVKFGAVATCRLLIGN